MEIHHLWSKLYQLLENETCKQRKTDFCCVNRITTRTAVIYIDQRGILHMEMIDGVEIDYEDAVDNAIVIKRIIGENKALKLIDSRASWTINKKARTFVKEIDSKQTIARAVLTQTTLSSLLNNFFTQLGKSKIPVKFFSNYEDACDWLLSFKV